MIEGLSFSKNFIQ